MSFERASKYLINLGYEDRIMEFDVSSATVELAAQAVGTEPERIAKSLTFKVGDDAVMVVCAGDAKISNQKFKEFFKVKATMLSRDEVEARIGHDVGGVCPFGINEGVKVYLDDSMKRFDYVYPACGSANSAVKLSLEELESTSKCIEWIDVCKLPEN